MSTSSTASSTGIPETSTPNKNTPREWTVQEIRNLVQGKFGKRPCWYQVKTALALYVGKDVIGCAPTGAGMLDFTMQSALPFLEKHPILESNPRNRQVLLHPGICLSQQASRLRGETQCPRVGCIRAFSQTQVWF